MKKYIIGLFSAICLMGAGCTEFEDFTPVDMGEGPAVTVTAEKTAVDAFKVTITPAEGTVYYSYIVTDEAMTVRPVVASEIRRFYIGESCRKTQRERYAF